MLGLGCFKFCKKFVENFRTQGVKLRYAVIWTCGLCVSLFIPAVFRLCMISFIILIQMSKVLCLFVCLYTFIFRICLFICMCVVCVIYMYHSFLQTDNLRYHLYTIGRKYKLLNASLDYIYFPGRLVHLHFTWLRYKTKIIMDHLR